MTLNDVGTLAKQIVRETNSDTITIGQMEAYVILTYHDWCRELQWPEASMTQNTLTPPGATATAQEYQLPTNLNKIFRVYLNGQRCAPTSISLLEGDVIGLFNPNWRILPSVVVPALSSITNLAVPITAGPAFAQLAYYTRGGYIGFMPAPAVDGYPIVIEGCIFPPDPGDGDTLLLPDHMKHGIAFGALNRFLLGARRVAEAKEWKALEMEQWGNAMRWRRNISGSELLPFVQPMGYRTWFSRNTIGNFRSSASHNI